MRFLKWVGYTPTLFSMYQDLSQGFVTGLYFPLGLDLKHFIKKCLPLLRLLVMWGSWKKRPLSFTKVMVRGLSISTVVTATHLKVDIILVEVIFHLDISNWWAGTSWSRSSKEGYGARGRQRLGHTYHSMHLGPLVIRANFIPTRLFQ